uniref:Uncharacterized protein n=1 Tax=Oryza barthii TaxID=65489 RepID=A0A0D3GY49_9ORYZ
MAADRGRDRQQRTSPVRASRRATSASSSAGGRPPQRPSSSRRESQAASRDGGGGAIFSASPRRWMRNRRMGLARRPAAAPAVIRSLLPRLLLLLLLSSLLALVFLLSWRLLYEPGKQVRSAVKIKNISKSHIAFKVLSYVGGFQGGEGWILGGAGQCDQLRHGCSWQWDFDVDRESSAPALVVVLRELGCTPFISICCNLLHIRSSRIDLI